MHIGRLTDSLPVKRTHQLKAYGDGHILGIGLVFSPDSKVLVSSMVDGTVKLWDVESRSLLRELGSATGLPAFSPSGTFLSTCDRESLSIWCGTSFDLVDKFTWAEEEAAGDLAVIDFAPDESTVVVGTGGYYNPQGWIRCWNVTSATETAHVKLGKDNNEEGVYSIRWKPNQGFIVYSMGETPKQEAHRIYRYDLSAGRCTTRDYEGTPYLLADGKTVVNYSYAQEVYEVSDFFTGEVIAVEPRPEISRWVRSSPDGRFAAWDAHASRQADEPPKEASVFVWDVENKTKISRLRIDPMPPTGVWSSRNDLFATVLNLARWPDKPDCTVFWNPLNGAVYGLANGHQMHAYYAFSPDGNWFASATTDHSASCQGGDIEPGNILITNLQDLTVPADGNHA